MSYFDFFNMVRENFSVFFWVMILSPLIIFLISNRYVYFGILDYFHFLISFNFGTSLSIVLLLFYYNEISIYYPLILMLYFFVFLFSFFCIEKTKIFYRVSRIFSKFLYLREPDSKLFFVFCFLFFLITAIVIVSKIGFGAFVEINRFEANRGSGIYTRIFQIIKIIVACSIAIGAWKCWKRKKYFKAIILILIWLLITGFSTILIGAKSDFIVIFYASAMSFMTYSGRRINGFLIALLVFPIAIIFAFFILYKNLSIGGIESFSESEYINGLPYIFDKFFNRILSNGDMYYLGIPNGIMDNMIVAENLDILMMYPFIGSTFLSNIVGFDVANISIGKQLLLYHHPDYIYAGGPVTHYDLFLIKYFGVFLGLFFIPVISFIVLLGYGVSKFSKENTFLSIFSTTLIVNSYTILLQPHIGIAHVFDVFVIFLSLIFVCKLFGTIK